MILYTLVIVALYPNIQYSEGLVSLSKFLETGYNKQISNDTLAELAEIVLKNDMIYLNLLEQLLNRKVELFLEQSLRLLMLFLLRLIFRKKTFGKKSKLVEVYK